MSLFIPEGEYVTSAEAAMMLGVSKQRISDLTREGKLPSVGADGTRLIPIAAVLDRKQQRAEAEKVELQRLAAKLAGEVIR